VHQPSYVPLDEANVCTKFVPTEKSLIETTPTGRKHKTRKSAYFTIVVVVVTDGAIRKQKSTFFII
jgi:hypothetical protein